MTVFNLILPVLMILLVVTVFVALFVGEMSRLRSRMLSRPRAILSVALCCVSLVPILFIAYLLGSFAVANFPFTSGMIAHASSPKGEEACVVQTFKGAEPYQVSLYARRLGQPWVWHYLAHQDDRWRSCRIEFTADQLRVYDGSTLRKSLSLAEVTRSSQDSGHDLPSESTPEQLLAQHDAYFRR